MTPHVRLSIGWLAGLSVVIFQTAVKFHFQAPIGELVLYCQCSTFALHGYWTKKDDPTI